MTLSGSDASVPQAVSVVASGWSFSQVPHDQLPGIVIAVNSAAIYLRNRPHFVVSMDRLWTEYYFDWLREKRVPAWLRKSAVQNIPDPWQYPWLTVFDCDNKSVTFTDEGKVLNGTNSGTCALALAHRMRPPNLFLFGFDMQNGPGGERYWHRPHPWVTGKGTTSGKYREWTREFELISKQFRLLGTRVVNVSSRTLIPAEYFPRLHPKHLQRYLNQGMPEGAVGDAA